MAAGQLVEGPETSGHIAGSIWAKREYAACQSAVQEAVGNKDRHLRPGCGIADSIFTCQTATDPRSGNINLQLISLANKTLGIRLTII